MCEFLCTVGVCVVYLWARACETQDSVGKGLHTEYKGEPPAYLIGTRSSDKYIYGKVSRALSRHCRLVQR